METTELWHMAPPAQHMGRTPGCGPVTDGSPQT